MSDPTGRGSSAWVTAIRQRVFPAPTMKLLAMTMADYVNGDDECWPGNALLGAELGITERQVQVLLAKLDALGILARGDARKEKGRKGRPRTAWVFLYAGLSKLPLAVRPLPEASSGNGPEIPEVAEPITGSPETDLPEVSLLPSSFRNPTYVEPPSRTLAPVAQNDRRDVLFEAVAEACGIDWNELTDSARGPLNRAVSQLRQIGAAPLEVVRRGEVYRSVYDGCALTPSALVKHWPSLNKPPAMPMRGTNRSLENGARWIASKGDR